MEASKLSECMHIQYLYAELYVESKQMKCCKLILYRSFEFSSIFDALNEQEYYGAWEKKITEIMGEEGKENKRKETVVMVTKEKDYEEENDNEEQKGLKGNKKQTNRTVAHLNLYLYCFKDRHSIKTGLPFHDLCMKALLGMSLKIRMW
jgi:hypothetical protein